MSARRGWQGKVFIATSVDGDIARADGNIAWLTDPTPIAGHAKPPADPPVIPGYEEHLASVDHLVIGRGTYEKVLTFGFWPYPQQHVIVLSRTLVTDDARITVAASTEQTLTLLAERGSTAVYVDGGKVIQDWLRRGLIDDIVLTRAPVLLGGGIPLFGLLDTDVHLIHLATTFNDAGMTSSHYRVAVPTDLG
jgi:dihydrofolate reductase